MGVLVCVLLRNTGVLEKGGVFEGLQFKTHLLEAGKPFGFSQISVFLLQRTGCFSRLSCSSAGSWLILSGNLVPVSFPAHWFFLFSVGFFFIYLHAWGFLWDEKHTLQKCLSVCLSVCLLVCLFVFPNTYISGFCFPVIPLYPQIWVILEKYGQA